ncbi:hypothetical protein [Streptomyces nigra]|uniref:hypothetical protein n=1 Tax=Streptomyces nigra TaxID=1827580 RepID=UPI003645B1CA
MAEFWFVRNVTVLMVGVTGLFAALFAYLDSLAVDESDAWRLSVENVRGLIAFLSVVCFNSLLVVNYRLAERKWMSSAADLLAARQCFAVLASLEEVVRGRGRILVCCNKIDELCTELGKFAASAQFSQRTGVSVSVRRHVNSVQQELIKGSESLLRDGVTAVPAMVSLLSQLLDGLAQERWLRLVEISTAGDNVDLPEVDATVERRDAWIVIFGALVAAVGLGLVTAFGLPLAAGVPAALVFLVGPAAIWGSRRLGVTPRGMMDSIRTSIADGANTTVDSGQHAAVPGPRQ